MIIHNSLLRFDVTLIIYVVPGNYLLILTQSKDDIKIRKIPAGILKNYKPGRFVLE